MGAIAALSLNWGWERMGKKRRADGHKIIVCQNIVPRSLFVMGYHSREFSFSSTSSSGLLSDAVRFSTEMYR